MRTRLTLARAFLLLMAGLAVVLGGLVYVQGTASRAAVADSAAVQRDAASEQVSARVAAYLGQADAAVEAIWNAPRPCADHPVWACRAALACVARTCALFASEAWEGLPALVTRFGIHTDRVMVGHFGAPDRFSFTAIGDGVNLAARLEPLCKQYGVVTLVSEAIVREAKDEFIFRRIDRVAVKGKTAGIDVYELLGAKGDQIDALPRARRYEEAFDAYLARDFERAITLIEPAAAEDPPSAVLIERCRRLAVHPPPPAWNGVHVASTK
jgi:adenylate cyclase